MVVLATALVAAPAARGATSLSLAEALSRALADGTSARIARLETERAGAGLGEARADYLPQVGLTSEAGWSNRLDEKLVALDENGQVKKYGLATIGANRGWLNLTVSQTLLDLRQWRKIERERLAVEVAEVAETRERDEVAYGVLQDYARVVQLERKADVTRQSMADADWLADRADDLHGAGRALEMDRALVRLHRSGTSLQARSWDDEARAAQADLRLAIDGDPPLRIVVDPESLPGVDPKRAASGAVDAVPSSPELRILDLRRRMKDAEVAAAMAGRLPTLKFVSGYSHYGPKRFDTYSDELFVGVNIDVPIFDGFRTGHKVRGAEREAEIARLRYRQTLREKRATVRELIRRLETGRQRLQMARDLAATAGEQVQLADLNLQAERGDLRGAVAARERHGRLALEAIDAEFAQLETWARLQRELGRLALEILGPGASGPAPATPVP